MPHQDPASTVPDAVDQMYSHPGFLLRRAHQIAASVFEQECDAVLTPPQFSVLSLIGTVPGVDQMTVARVVGFDRTTVAVVIGNLERQGWVEKQSDPRDGRRYCLVATRAGLRVLEQVRARAERSEKRLLSAFSAAESRQFVALLRRFVDSFNEDSRAPVDATALPIARLRQRRPTPGTTPK
jgi:DNA-binding MarR family transcriptional regulator